MIRKPGCKAFFLVLVADYFKLTCFTTAKNLKAIFRFAKKGKKCLQYILHRIPLNEKSSYFQPENSRSQNWHRKLLPTIPVHCSQECQEYCNEKSFRVQNFTDDVSWREFLREKHSTQSIFTVVSATSLSLVQRVPLENHDKNS